MQLEVYWPGADPETSKRGGQVPQPLPQPPNPPPSLERKLCFSEHAAYSIVSVFVMQS